MRLFVYNGSPRGKNGNTYRMMERLIEGFESKDGNQAEMFHISQTRKTSESLGRLDEADAIVVAFPIYFHSMPGPVKAFLDSLAERQGRPRILFFMQCGFPDTAQCLPMERYLTKWASRNRFEVIGIAIKGFGPSLEAMPNRTNEGWLKDIHALGHCVGTGKALPEDILLRLRDPIHFPPLLLLFMRLLAWLGIFDLYSKKRLKKNRVSTQKSYAQPLLAEQEQGVILHAENERRRS